MEEKGFSCLFPIKHNLNYNLNNHKSKHKKSIHQYQQTNNLIIHIQLWLILTLIFPFFHPNLLWTLLPCHQPPFLNNNPLDHNPQINIFCYQINNNLQFWTNNLHPQTNWIMNNFHNNNTSLPIKLLLISFHSPPFQSPPNPISSYLLPTPTSPAFSSFFFNTGHERERGGRERERGKRGERGERGKRRERRERKERRWWWWSWSYGSFLL